MSKMLGFLLNRISVAAAKPGEGVKLHLQQILIRACFLFGPLPILSSIILMSKLGIWSDVQFLCDKECWAFFPLRGGFKIVYMGT